MDMQNRRFEGEENLSRKLEAHNSGYSAQDLKDFENLLDKQKKTLPWFKIISFGAVLSLLLVLLFWGYNDHNPSESGANESSFINEQEINLQQIDNGTEVDETIQNSNKSQLVESMVAKKQAINNDSEAGFGKSINGEISTKSLDNYLTYNDAVNYDTKSGNGLESKGRDNPSNTISESGYPQNEVDKLPVSSGDTQVNNKLISPNSKDSEASVFTIDLLPYPSLFLEADERKLDDLEIESKIIPVEERLKKRISFGIQYNTGKTHAGAHETPFVSNYETFIDGGKSFGYGFFGHVNLSKRMSMRPSFTYNKNTHLHFVNGLVFQTGPTDINLELYSHEVKFGMDYAFNFLPNIKYVDLKAGAGLAYHKVISLESNNYYTSAPETVINNNELDLSPFSYKAFVALDIPIYKGIVIGIEPYMIYQKRRARFTPSTFVADQGDYNIISGINMSMRF